MRFVVVFENMVGTCVFALESLIAIRTIVEGSLDVDALNVISDIAN